MDLSNRQKEKIQENNIKDQISRYIYLAFLVFIFSLNFYEYFQLNNRPQIVRKELEAWIVAKSINDSIGFYKAKVQKSSALIQEYQDLIESQRQLYTKIKASYISDSRDDDHIKEIVIYQNKLGSFQQLQTQVSAEHKEILLQQKIIELKGKTIISKGDKYNAFQKEITNSFSRINSLCEQLLNIVTQNREWKSKIQQKYKEKEKNTKKPQVLLFDLFDIQAYQTLPYLAKEVLDPDNILKLAKLLYSPPKNSNQPDQFDLRQKKVRQRVQLANQRSKLESFPLMKYNLQSATDSPKWESDILSNYQILNKKYQLDEIVQQKKICILVPTYNNNKNFRVEANLNSIFAQNYTNYRTVIIDDASNDKTAQKIQSYLSFYKINKDKALLKKNSVNKKALQNLYLAGLNDCSDTEIIVIVDGDDELIGLNNLKVINSVYTKQNLGVVYSSFYYYNPTNYYVTAGFTSQYLPEEKKALRKSPQRFSHLITFKTELLSSIDPKDLKEEDGSFYNVAYDFAMIYPMMQLSCGRVKKINQFQYLYSIGTGANDYQLFEQKQKDIGKSILNKEQYKCLDSYKES